MQMINRGGEIQRSETQKWIFMGRRLGGEFSDGDIKVLGIMTETISYSSQWWFGTSNRNFRSQGCNGLCLLESGEISSQIDCFYASAGRNL